MRECFSRLVVPHPLAARPFFSFPIHEQANAAAQGGQGTVWTRRGGRRRHPQGLLQDRRQEGSSASPDPYASSRTSPVRRNVPWTVSDSFQLKENGHDHSIRTPCLSSLSAIPITSVTACDTSVVRTTHTTSLSLRAWPTESPDNHAPRLN